MTVLQERIVKGCKFIANIGSTNWQSDQTKRALKRLSDLINDELSGVDPIATPEMSEKIFNNEV